MNAIDRLNESTQEYFRCYNKMPKSITTSMNFNNKLMNDYAFIKAYEITTNEISEITHFRGIKLNKAKIVYSEVKCEFDYILC